MLTLRRRHVYPSADLATGHPRFDLALDQMSRVLRRDHHGLNLDALDPAMSLVVLGFPRSGNTTLSAWLDRFVYPDVTVVDGRITHSALDIVRCVDRSIPVIIPARPAVDTCASMMVRAGKPDSEAYGRQILRAYAAWYREATKTLAAPTVSAVAFETITVDPWHACTSQPIASFIDAETAAGTDVGEFLDDLRRDLSGVTGQGQPQDGVPAAMMISLPDAGRREHLRTARAILTSTQLARQLSEAEAAFNAFVAKADAEDSWNMGLRFPWLALTLTGFGTAGMNYILNIAS